MKLSKAQHEVVDRMRAGEILKFVYFKGAFLDNKKNRMDTLQGLINKGIVSPILDTDPIIYQLTEKYLNNE